MEPEKREKTLREHMRDAVRARWAKTTLEERKAYSKKMHEARYGKNANISTSTGE